MNETMYFKDENGNEMPLVMVDAFEFEQAQYALFMTPMENIPEDEEPAMYIMKPVIQDNEIKDFEMPTDEEMEAVTPFLIERLEGNHSCGGSCSGCSGCGDGAAEGSEQDHAAHDHAGCDCGH